MKKSMSALFIALVLAFASSAHAISGPLDPTPDSPDDSGIFSPDTRGPIDPFPPPTFSIVLSSSHLS